MCPIIGIRYHKVGFNYDLCEAEFAKLTDAEKAKFEKITKPQLIRPTASHGHCQRRRHRHMPRTSTCPAFGNQSEPTVVSEARMSQEYEDNLQKAIAESLTMSEKALATRKKEEEDTIKREEEVATKMKEGAASGLSESLTAGLAAEEALAKARQTKENEDVEAEKAKLNMEAGQNKENEDIEAEKGDGKLTRYVQSFLQNPVSRDAASVLLLSSSSGHSDASKSTDEDHLVEASMKMSTIGTNVSVDANAALTPALTPKARFVCDVSCPDKSVVLSNSTLQKTWRFRNDGAAKWPDGTSIVHVSGDFAGSYQTLTNLPAPGGEVNVTMTLNTPSLAGRYVGYFRLETPDPASQRFGHRVWVDIMVVQAVERSTSVSSSTSQNSENSFTIVDLPEEDLSNESFDALSLRFEALAQESLTILNEPLDSNANAMLPPQEEITVDNAGSEYEDDFENDDESPRKRSRDVVSQKSSAVMGASTDSVSSAGDLPYIHYLQELQPNDEVAIGIEPSAFPVDADELPPNQNLPYLLQVGTGEKVHTPNADSCSDHHHRGKESDDQTRIIN
jgi:hypothetical protein